ncbi:MAG: hypothetical protein EPN25_13320 [Nitrospirae bacterium]|nr:MAG: hypothetical protein EPN25_13320 [Nitrospirota bacterium]
MPYRNVSITAISLIFVCVIVWTFVYGPAKRTFVSPDKIETVKSAEELDKLWHSAGVHGRVAVIFTRYLNKQFAGASFPEMDYIDNAMRHGIIRTVYYIVPDRFGAEIVSDYYLKWDSTFIVPPKLTDTGLIILHDGGRIYVMPLSKYIPDQEQEKALVVIEDAVWTPQERDRINGFTRSGQLASDLTAIVSESK